MLTHVNCTARLFPRITEQKSRLREWKQKHLSKAAKDSKKETSKMKTEWGEVVSYWTFLQCETEEPMYMRSRSQGTLVKSHRWWCHVAASWGGEERWEVEVLWLCLTEQGHFPYQWIPPALSLPPDGSRTQPLAVSLRQRDFRPFPCRLAGTKQGFNFRKGSSLLLQTFFSQRTGSGFRDWAGVALHQTVTLLGSRKPPLTCRGNFPTFSRVKAAKNTQQRN